MTSKNDFPFRFGRKKKFLQGKSIVVFAAMSLIHTPSKDATNKLRPVLADDEIEARIKVMADGCTKTLKVFPLIPLQIRFSVLTLLGIWHELCSLCSAGNSSGRQTNSVPVVSSWFKFCTWLRNWLSRVFRYRSLSKCVSLISPERHQQLLASVWVFEWETDVRTVWAYLDVWVLFRHICWRLSFWFTWTRATGLCSSTRPWRPSWRSLRMNKYRTRSLLVTRPSTPWCMRVLDEH